MIVLPYAFLYNKNFYIIIAIVTFVLLGGGFLSTMIELLINDPWQFCLKYILKVKELLSAIRNAKDLEELNKIEEDLSFIFLTKIKMHYSTLSCLFTTFWCDQVYLILFCLIFYPKPQKK